MTERVAYILQAAVWLASQTLSLPIARKRAPAPPKEKAPEKSGAFSLKLAETEGVAYILQAAVWLASQTLRLPIARMALPLRQIKSPRLASGAFHLILAETEGFEPSIQV